MAALDVMADFAVCAKARLGLAVSMAPAESYLDALGPPGMHTSSFISLCFTIEKEGEGGKPQKHYQVYD